MTEQEQRIAIAEACGWKLINYGPPGHENLYWKVIRPDGTLRRHSMTGNSFARAVFSFMVPDYPQDLNAMHEVVMTLDRKTLAYSNYCSHLQQIVAIQNSKSNDPGIQAIDATAAQRAEAFLKTLNLWKP